MQGLWNPHPYVGNTSKDRADRTVPTLIDYPAAVRTRSQPGVGRRLPSLDGLRAVAIGMVLLGHLCGTRGFGFLDLQIGDYSPLFLSPQAQRLGWRR